MPSRGPLSGHGTGKGRGRDREETWEELMPEWRVDRVLSRCSGQTGPHGKGPGPREHDSFENCR